MNLLNRLAKGELSLAATFWGFLVPGSVLPFVIIVKLITANLLSITIGGLVTIILVVIIQFMIACMVTLGIFSILRKKITFWGVIAFIISILNLIYSTYVLFSIFQ